MKVPEDAMYNNGIFLRTYMQFYIVSFISTMPHYYILQNSTSEIANVRIILLYINQYIWSFIFPKILEECGRPWPFYFPG